MPGSRLASKRQHCRSTEDAGTEAFDAGSILMSEPIPWLIENAIQIAWHYLESTGQIIDSAEASKCLLKTVDEMVLKGEHRKLMLANRAIDAYRNRCKLRQVP